MSVPSPAIAHLLSKELSFDQLMDEVPLAMAVLDRDLHVVWLNRAFEALTGFSRSEAYGVPCRHIVRSRACVENCPTKKGAISAPTPCESDIINRDRIRLPVKLTLAPLTDPSGTITGYVETIEDLRAVRELDSKKNQAFSFEGIIGRSEKMEKLFQTLPILAQSDASILITGETGTGKDVVAEAIHQTSSRTSGPFIKINCGALPETLLESELFGHAKGAFTGAVESKPGRFRMAHNGTLFLTEVGDLPLPLQVKLLTFLDDQVIYPLGETRPFHANVRVIAATHRNLSQMVADGTFRQDLLFRLNVARIHLPPLRERKGDIRILLDHFLEVYRKQLGKRITGFSQETLTTLSHYRFTGNVRELRNIVEFAASMATEPTIGVEDLPAYLMDPPPVPVSDAPSPDTAPTSNTPPVPEPSQPRTWATTERDMILEALKDARGKRQQAAERLGWGRSTLWRKMKHYGINT
ncbi:sigma-54-dependent Fis family transcriptional regulator [Desulfoluna limicola]|uniref:Sigma-54-dependent Fis family transcriptional regulator n=1 Tax=Desulfoluna limicola TaxID=2810562 RepID=A0ABN6FAN9_9BACT|nr:sigma 54-interacting transcriptional regulator [Desulfoluna limicola]BCS98527.1 sigma-54-dependent Fis family transcriptional regulator [Desulfoluna limicola]